MASIKEAFTTNSGPTRTVVFTALISSAVVIFTSLLGWPLWRVGLTMLLPWLPLLTQETIRFHRHYAWLALFYVLVVTQSGHFFEHVAQMIQIHVLGLTGANARGVFGALDIEWVHFMWNAWVGLGVLLLLAPFRGNPWLWATAIVTTWHGIEHGVILSVYLTTGEVGTPGLLSRGGLIGGGLPLTRPDLHFVYNLIETIPLVFAFVSQIRRSVAHSKDMQARLNSSLR